MPYRLFGTEIHEQVIPFESTVYSVSGAVRLFVSGKRASPKEINYTNQPWGYIGRGWQIRRLSAPGI